MQLVAYGAQDIYLTGNPQITFFKVVYRRHTNFAMESMQQTISGNNALAGRGVCKLSRNGDLVSRLYLQSTCASTQVVNSSVTDKIGNQIVGLKIERSSSGTMNLYLPSKWHSNKVLPSIVCMQNLAK